MIYFDTASGKIVIDTEVNRVQEKLIISRGVAGIEIQQGRPSSASGSPAGKSWLEHFGAKTLLNLVFQG